MRFRKKPVEVEAQQFWPDKKPWPDGVTAAPPLNPERYVILTLEGIMRVSPGDWIITGVKGEKYPCKPDIFEQTYEPVTEQEESGTCSTCCYWNDGGWCNRMATGFPAPAAYRCKEYKPREADDE